MTRRVVITGIGCVSGLGAGLDETWRRALAGDGAIRLIDEGEGARAMRGPAAPADRTAIDAMLAGHDLRRLGQLDAISKFALAAANEAVGQAGLNGHPVLGERTAIVLGCGSGGNATIDTGFERLYGKGLPRVHPQTIPASMVSAPAGHLAMFYGVHGPAWVIASACASSAHALGEAMHLIRAGRVDVALAGGAEACLSPGSWVAWQSLGVIAPDTCRPFSEGRKGLVLGEGAAVLVLESEEHAAARGATVLGELAGYGGSTDAMHATAPDQAGVERAIRNAHADAGLAFDTPALISTHGTGTKLNDATEAAAMRAVYGDALGSHTAIATKSAHGHLIGAGGALEFAIGMKALIEGMAPPLLNFAGPDPECDLPLAHNAAPIVQEILVANSFAFGGLNAVLIGRKP